MHISHSKETKEKEWEESNKSTELEKGSSSGRINDIFRLSADAQRRLNSSGCNDQTPVIGRRQDTSADTKVKRKNTEVSLNTRFYPPVDSFSLRNVLNLLSFLTLLILSFILHRSHRFLIVSPPQFIQFLLFLSTYFQLRCPFCVVAGICAASLLYFRVCSSSSAFIPLSSPEVF